MSSEGRDKDLDSFETSKRYHGSRKLVAWEAKSGSILITIKALVGAPDKFSEAPKRQVYFRSEKRSDEQRKEKVLESFGGLGVSDSDLISGVR